MTKIVVARVYSNQSIEFSPPSDAIFPPSQDELRVTRNGDQMHHLEIFKDQEWVDLGEVTSELLKEYDMDPFMGF